MWAMGWWSGTASDDAIGMDLGWQDYAVADQKRKLLIILIYISQPQKLQTAHFGIKSID